MSSAPPARIPAPDKPEQFVLLLQKCVLFDLLHRQFHRPWHHVAKVSRGSRGWALYCKNGKLSQSIPMFYHICPAYLQLPLFSTPGLMVLGYFTKGRGHMAILAFHGFGQDHTAFNGIADALAINSLFSFDLFFHGKASGLSTKHPYKTYWKVLMEKFWRKIQLSVSRYWVLVWAEKFVLACLEAFPAKNFGRLPVGARWHQNKFWYRLATYRCPSGGCSKA